ncbi:MAG TPA: translational machinery protein [Noviherbaspirillum sp.]|uniref:translational machinery protein n=1 Tax=Noviherbaspirillum sp. TaxID=1926288 RepID=UPI002D2D964D|nr:translational machinery protein [Noviherbaspirillum sp.]HYD94089.1 translational machinery protein [Noviherbaspirillum sp.]
MPSNHVVWVDYADACIGSVDSEITALDIIRTYRADPAPAGAARSTRAPETMRFFDDIAAHLHAAHSILIVGPGFERLELLVYLRRHFPALADRIVALEGADRPSAEAVLPCARRHFRQPEAA